MLLFFSGENIILSQFGDVIACGAIELPDDGAVVPKRLSVNKNIRLCVLYLHLVGLIEENKLDIILCLSLNPICDLDAAH